MVGMGEVAALAGSLKSAFDLIKTIKAASDALGDAEFKLKIADLYVALADAKTASVDLQEALSEKDKEIERLKTQWRRTADETVARGAFRYRKGQDGTAVGLPFCSRCLAVDGRLIETTYVQGHGTQMCKCPQCSAAYARVETFIEEHERSR